MFSTLPVQASSASLHPAAEDGARRAAKPPPDIYYIIFDEYAGFDSVHSYWQDDFDDSFEAFLKQNNFFVATGSRSPTLNTGAEIASRLNLQPYPEKLSGVQKEKGIDNNKVMQVLKANGYTTVAIDTYFQSIDADIVIRFDPANIEAAAKQPHNIFLDSSVIGPSWPVLSYFIPKNQQGIEARNQVLYSLEKTVHPGDIQSPKFVYAHILLPHEPFIFDENGGLLPAEAHDNWDYYLGQLKYSTVLAQKLITALLAQADPDNPPVIILQSDHGARNIPSIGKGGVLLNNLLKNYSLAYAHDILNALYLPGFDTTTLSNSMDPTGTFAVVLNHYLDAGLAVDPTPVKDWHDPATSRVAPSLKSGLSGAHPPGSARKIDQGSALNLSKSNE